MATKYSLIPDNGVFKTTKGTYRKLDAIYFEDLVSGYQETWNPIFDATIIEESHPSWCTVAEASVEFITDPQSRIITKNPNYDPNYKANNPTVSEAEEAFGEMWGSTQFDCGPEDFQYMGEQSVAAVKAMNELTTLVGLLGNSTVYQTVIDTLTKAYKKTTKAPTKGKRKNARS
jgi:hypothetical protein